MPGDLARPLREYQKVSIQMTWALKGLLNADAGGIGKTVEGIGISLNPKTLPIVVVTLTDLPPQWRDSINEFAPQFDTHILRGTTPYDLTKVKIRARGIQQVFGAKFPDFVLMNYKKLAGWAEYLTHYAHSVIWDEIQELRTGPGTQTYDAACLLADSVDYRLGLSATPTYNYPGSELYNILRCVRPDFLGTRDEFLMEWCKGTGRKAMVVNTGALRDHLKTSGIMLQRTRKDVQRELPGNGEPIIISHIIGSDQAAFTAEIANLEQLAKIIMQDAEAFKGQKMIAARKFNSALREATGIAKAPHVADFLRLLVESGDRPVVFGWHRKFWDIVAERLADLRPAFWTGHESARQKANAKERFLSGDTDIIGISLRAGAGIDGLQERGNVAVMGELDFSVELHWQNILRIYRDGQKDIVRAYFLIAQSGSDPAMSEILNVKSLQNSGIMGTDAIILEDQLDPDHMRHLASSFLAQLSDARRTDRADVNGSQLGLIQESIG
jgi:SNF2 family DNA or RNA helicase